MVDAFNGIFSTTYSGSGRRTIMTRGAGKVSAIYFNRYLQFAIYMDFVAATSTRNQERAPPSFRTWSDGTFTTQAPTLTLIVKCRGAVILRESLNPVNSPKFVAYSAADPMTGAIVVNLQGLERIGAATNFKVAKSWIFAVDDTGAKEIQEILEDLPVNTRVKENKLLYSL